jgi:hypothetical protein
MSGSQSTGNPSYIERKIDITLILGEGTFGTTGQNTVKLSNLRCAVTVNEVGFPSYSMTEARIYGLTPSLMQQLSTMGVPLPMQRKNQIIVEAGDAVNGMAVVASNYILTATQKFAGMPETFLQVVSNTGAFDAMAPVPPISFPGAADVATIMSGIAVRMGRTFENNGVQVQLSNPYFPGTAIEQAHSLARAADIELFDEGPGRRLAIWPKNKTRGGAIPLISVASGLIGYPESSDQGMRFRCLFNPNIALGGQIQMQSSLGTVSNPPVAATGSTQQQVQAAGPNGIWYVGAPLSHDLSAQIPNGPWFTDACCARTFLPKS